MKKPLLLMIIVFSIISCSDKQKETELQNNIVELENQLNDCENGADKLFAKIQIAFEKQDFGSVKTIYADFEKKHPESNEFQKTKSIYEQAIKLEKKIRKEKERVAEKEKQEKLKALNKLKKNYDDVAGITWYKQPYFTHYTNTNLTSIYIGDNGTSKWLRIMMSYNGDDWIFFEKAYLSYDGNTIEIIFNKYDDKDTENSGGAVWEWIDLTVTKDVESFLKEFAKSKNAKMRLSGKYTKTRALSTNEKNGILDVLNGYETLKNE